jgi:hypothetical protein
MPGWKAELHERKSLRSADKNRSADLSYKNAFGPTRKSKLRCRLEGGAAQAQKPQGCRLKTGRPDLSYKMQSDPPFRSDPSQAPFETQDKQGKKGGAPEKANYDAGWKGAARAQKPQVCRPKTGRPDLSYKRLHRSDSWQGYGPAYYCDFFARQ